MHQKPRIPPRPKEDGVSCCMMDEEKNTIYPNGDNDSCRFTHFWVLMILAKKINVFITHEGSSFSGTIDTIKELEPEAEVTEGLAVRGGSVAEEEDNIRQWVKDK